MYQAKWTILSCILITKRCLERGAEGPREIPAPTKEEARGRGDRAGSTEQRAKVFEKGLQGTTAPPAAHARGVSWQQAGFQLWNVNEAGCWQGTAAAAEPSSLPEEKNCPAQTQPSLLHLPWWCGLRVIIPQPPRWALCRTHTAHSPRYS